MLWLVVIFIFVGMVAIVFSQPVWQLRNGAVSLLIDPIHLNLRRFDEETVRLPAITPLILHAIPVSLFLLCALKPRTYLFHSHTSDYC
jgi:hypothetical protein